MFFPYTLHMVLFQAFTIHLNLTFDVSQNWILKSQGDQSCPISRSLVGHSGEFTLQRYTQLYSCIHKTFDTS